MAVRAIYFCFLVAFLFTGSNGWWRRRRRGAPPPASCAALPNPRLGTVKPPSLGHGSKATYTCNPNYKIQGVPERTCSNGAWSGIAPSCVLACPTPTRPTNGKVDVHDTSAHYSCYSSYKLVGTSPRLCRGQNWSGTPPRCVTGCGALPNPQVGNVEWNGLGHGSKATYTCHPNYKVQGVKERTCNNGAWSDTAPTCSLACPAAARPTNGKVAVQDTSAQYSCNSGYKLVGTSSRLCRDQNWSGTPPRCVKVCTTSLNSPLHGQVQSSGDKALYTCSTNYRIEGARTRECINGMWEGNEPICVLACGHLHDPLNGKVVIVGTTATYSCNANHTITGSIVRRCKDRLWTDNAPTCNKDCLRLPYPANGYVTVSNNGRTGTYHCHRNHRLDGNQVRTCMNGRWSGSDATCVLACGPLSTRNGHISIIGVTAYYECDSGFTLVGDRTRECNDGTWAGTQTRCEKECDPPAPPSNGFVTVSSRTAKFFCLANFYLVGTSPLTCSHGVWSGTLPACKLSCVPIPIADGTYNVFDIAVVYKCNSGYQLFGDVARVCYNRTWSGKQPTCNKGGYNTLNGK